MLKSKVCETISRSKYLELRKAEYKIVQAIPSKACRNSGTDKILTLANTMYRKLDKLVRYEDKKLIIESKLKLSYYIHITKSSTEFYFLVPSIFHSQFKTKLSETWKNVEVSDVSSLPININAGTKYQLKYKNSDALSLDTDRKNNLLNANLSILEILKEDESVGVFYNFMPLSLKEQNYFKVRSQEDLSSFKKGINLKKNKSFIDLGMVSLRYTFDFINSLLDVMFGTNSTKSVTAIERNTTNSTDKKVKGEIIKTQAVVYSKGRDIDREKMLCTSLYNTFTSINGDNELILKDIKGDVNVFNHSIGIKSNFVSTLEGGKFVNIASRDAIEQHDGIKHNKILEKYAPKCLEKGEIRLGEVKVKDSRKTIYYSSDYQIKRLGRILLGPMGAGKDYYMENLAKDIINAGRGLIVIDYIDTCQLASNIQAITPKDKLIEINFADPKTLQTFAYDEYSYKESDSEHTKVDICMQKAQQYNMLLDSINDVTSALTPRMLRYLNAAATVAYRINLVSSFKKIIDMLKDPDKRNEVIMQLPIEARELLQDEIDDLKDLDKYDTKGNIVGNCDSKIDGILDRVSKLKTSSIYTKLAYVKDSSNNINFIDAINEGKVILIKIPAKKFSKTMRSVLATFMLQKIWIAKEQGATKTQTELFINEIHQSYHSQLLMEDMLVECRKFNLTPTLSLHYLDQCTKDLQKSLLASGASFLLIQGTDIKVYNELRRYFEKDGYTENDLAELDRYNALALVKNEDTGYSSFVVKLPE